MIPKSGYRFSEKIMLKNEAEFLLAATGAMMTSWHSR